MKIIGQRVLSEVIWGWNGYSWFATPWAIRKEIEVHSIAGTSGKGSVSAFLGEVLKCSGMKVGSAHPNGTANAFASTVNP